jgi:hypothetical protein
MPKIDPHTGCVVMTQAEFWSSEAKREGKGRQGSDLYEEFVDDMDDDLKAEEGRLRDPKLALDYLMSTVKQWNESDPEMDQVPVPTEVLEVVTAKITQNFRQSGIYLVARVRSNDLEGTLEVSETSYSGSWDEPPDHEENVIWKPVGTG